MKTDNIIKEKTYNFARRIVRLYRFLIENREYILSKQILRSGTSIGANVEEAIAAQSKKDFIAKMYIALKEARETNYWLRILNDEDFVKTSRIENLKNESIEIIKVITSIIKSTQKQKKVIKN